MRGMGALFIYFSGCVFSLAFGKGEGTFFSTCMYLEVLNLLKAFFISSHFSFRSDIWVACGIKLFHYTYTHYFYLHPKPEEIW